MDGDTAREPRGYRAQAMPQILMARLPEWDRHDGRGIDGRHASFGPSSNASSASGPDFGEEARVLNPPGARRERIAPAVLAVQRVR